MLTIAFRNEAQETFFNFTKRNSCFSGGYGNGKSYTGCQKILLLSLTFPGYRTVIARKTYKSLKSTTMATFFKLLPDGKKSEFIERHSETDGITVFKNGSEILWMHLDEVNETSLRGLEINSVLIDQAEEIDESVYLTLDARIGRWDQAKVPPEILTEDFPRDAMGRPQPPSYMMVLVNPDIEYHWVWRRYHYDSPEWKAKYHATHDYVERGTDESMYTPDTIEQMKSRDPEWVARFFQGKWGIGEGSIHIISSKSILHVTAEQVKNFLSKAALYRSMDHGDSAPTCCLWFGVFGGVHVCYREYYSPGQLISYHRKAIVSLSTSETYMNNLADPAIFKKASQKNGGFWCVADEYTDHAIDAPPIAWNPADNNEHATRNRINEWLRVDPALKNPLTGEQGCPRLLFIARSEQHEFGVENVIHQVRAQKRELLDTINGKSIFSDERDKNVADHAYDPLRYYVASHSQGMREIRKKYEPGTMGYARKVVKALNKSGYFKEYYGR